MANLFKHVLEFLKQFDAVFGGFNRILLGFLLGVLGPGIVERIRRPYRRRDLTRPILDEMLDLQYTIATVAVQIRAYFAQASDAFIDEVLPIIEKYSGPGRDENFINALKGLRSRPEAVRAEVERDRRRSNPGLTLRQYSIPLFVTQIGDLAICSLDFQRAVLHIRYHLDLLNEDAISAQSLRSFSLLAGCVPEVFCTHLLARK